MRKIMVPVIGLILAISLLTSCATSEMKKSAVVTKISAEETYDLIYTMYINETKIGEKLIVTRESKDLAARIYDRYEVAQQRVAIALTDKDFDEVGQQAEIAKALASELISLAFELGVR